MRSGPPPLLEGLDDLRRYDFHRVNLVAKAEAHIIDVPSPSAMTSDLNPKVLSPNAKLTLLSRVSSSPGSPS